MHHPFITLPNASYHASPIRHTASQHIIPVKHYIQQITLTHNALDASQRWCIITTMHHSDDASQQCIMALMHYGTTSLKQQGINLLLKITTYLITITLIIINRCEKLETISIFNPTYLCVLQRALILSWSAPLHSRQSQAPGWHL